ncbi:glycosyltransferase involved in cell wall biosynthesis [Parabacteroides sp. PFB2-10]|uniref:glycosyltransferase family 4 protein n=1 Tax=Parabacteroides sp. PFB2-10 TaxID=1742405 RepID=UPI0024744FCB|nr:glycosyltransferase family 4 protein [Parabacteroides sp. PFB2-10]MDH6313527.1 glycosyltransferase involved in cell wall biosynthesis [Parabacteroides sp. PFB2-10]
MNIVVTGLRGFPNIQGGIETHCEELYPRLAGGECHVTVVRRKNFVKEDPPYTNYKGVHFKDINAPRITGLEAALHTMYAVWYAYRSKADIVHIHAIGPAITVPFARLLGLKVVVTHHGPDYDREKWGFFAKSILKLGEYFAAKQAHQIIAISTVITDLLKKKYKRTKGVHLIYNGVTTLPKPSSTDFLQHLGIKPNQYILAVGRFVEEKRFDWLIEAYIKLNNPNYQLVIAGDADYESSYSTYLKNFAYENDVILTGIVKGEKLAELYAHAALFVLPSSHEGLPITLLEAMSYKRKVLASDIPANLAVRLEESSYFTLNSTKDMKEKMAGLLARPETEQAYDLSLYDWDNIAVQTHDVYKEYETI